MGAGSEQTADNKYIPTPAEMKLLEVLANPENIGCNVSDLCQLAGVSRNVYYDGFKKPEFVSYYEQLTRDIIKQSVQPVVNACIKEAKAGSYNHAKLVLEMAGMYTPKQNMELTGKDGGPVKIKVKVGGEDA